MVAPIKGPTTVYRGLSAPVVGSYYDLRVRWTQAKPCSLVLPYTREKYVTVFSNASPPSYAGDLANAGSSSDNKVGPYFFNHSTWSAPTAQARNVVVEKYRSEAYKSAELLVTLIQRKEAMDMVTSRTRQLLKLAVAIATRNYKKVGRALAEIGAPTPGRKTWRTVSRDFASAWLELSYGWLPLVKDVGTAVSILEAPIDSTRIKVRGKKVLYSRVVDGSVLPYEIYIRKATGYVRYAAGGRIAVDNPNLYLATSMGFTNPLTVAWELVPFSFVVDWFVPVQGFLQNFTSSHGISEQDTWNTAYWKATGFITDRVLPPYVAVSREIGTDGLKVERSLGIPGITLIRRPPWQLSPWRAANAISLLVGFLKKKA